MKKLMMLTCPSCRRIKHFDKWVLIENIVPEEVKRNLAHLIQAGVVEFVAVYCADCLDNYNPT